MFKNKITFITISVLVILLCVAAFVTYELTSPSGYYARQHADIKKIEPKGVKPYTDLSGKVVSLKEFEGKPLIINAWASWSPYSKNDFELLGVLKKEFGDKVNIVAVDRMETKETAEAYLSTIGRVDGITYIVDQDDHFFQIVEGYAMPETLFYDAVGNIVFHKRGSLEEGELKTYTDAITKMQ